MATERNELLALLELHLCTNEGERNRLWRRGMASLAVLGKSRPVPLEGLDPLALQESVRVAIESGLVDDMDWLSSSPRALFDLMISLPRGKTKRDLGRRVLRLLFSANASAFTKLVTVLAAASPRILKNPEVRSRISLCLQLPIGLVPEVDQLCLALLSCAQTRQTWLVQPSSGNLIERRLAARILERAAREALRRKMNSNTSGLRVLDFPDIRQCWTTLLMDREPLVWRHAAAAVGVLVDCRLRHRQLLETGLEPDASHGALRRSLCILSASIAVRGARSLLRCLEHLETVGQINRDDPMHTMLFGIESAASFEAGVADVLLNRMAELCHFEHGSEIFEIRRQSFSRVLGQDAVRILKKRAQASMKSTDSFCVAQASWLLQEACAGLTQSNDEVEGNVNAAVLSYVTDGVPGLRSKVELALAAAHAEVATLGNHGSRNRQEQRIQYRAIRRIERHVLRNSLLACLVEIVGPRSIDTESDSLEVLHGDLHSWLLRYHELPLDGQNSHELAWQRSYMQTLIRLVDADSERLADSEVLRRRRTEVVHTVLRRLDDSVPASLRRIPIVCLARACDALIRETSCEVSDILLGVIPTLKNSEDRIAFSEASLISPMGAMVSAYSRLYESNDASIGTMIGSLRTLLDEIPCDSSPRVEALRGALHLLYQALDPGHEASINQSSDPNRTDANIVALAEACQWLAQLSNGARLRMELSETHSAPLLGTAIRQLDFASSPGSLAGSLEGCYALADDELPDAFAMVVRRVLSPLGIVKKDAPTGALKVHHRAKRRSVVPAQTTVSGYCILSNIGTGGAGSVYLVCREEHKTDEVRPLYALKRPRYSGEHSQVLSEKEFIDMFRREAETLLTLPKHRNLAAFVTFDLGATPDPILVMEYIEGPHLGRLMESRNLSCTQVLSLLDGVAEGLEVMHSIEVGHLDLKPENIIVRDGNAVLVDFGLAGRQYRPGCGTLYYAAPELFIGEQRGSARPADVYSFACLVYELFCKETLFDGESQKEIVRSHLSHDGTPKALVALSKGNRKLLGLTRLLGTALRQDPQRRTTMVEFRKGLSALHDELASQSWPLGRNQEKREELVSWV
ncbi:MAG: serine/threonine protein kinase [Kofleriaceae bacterium]|nr:serine/threonine protein kinase [Kofleriaceae bacterium]